MGSLGVSKHRPRGLDAKFVKQSDFSGCQPVASSSFSDVTSLNTHESEISRRFSITASERTLKREDVIQPQLRNAPYDWASSSIGFKLLQKAGWKEGTGLGVAEQGRLEPLEAQVKLNKGGIGAQKDAKKDLDEVLRQTRKNHCSHEPHHKKSLSRSAKKALANEKRVQEQILQRDFFKEFWPENV